MGISILVEPKNNKETGREQGNKSSSGILECHVATDNGIMVSSKGKVRRAAS